MWRLCFLFWMLILFGDPPLNGEPDPDLQFKTRIRLFCIRLFLDFTQLWTQYEPNFFCWFMVLSGNHAIVDSCKLWKMSLCNKELPAVNCLNLICPEALFNLCWIKYTEYLFCCPCYMYIMMAKIRLQHISRKLELVVRRFLLSSHNWVLV